MRSDSELNTLKRRIPSVVRQTVELDSSYEIDVLCGCTLCGHRWAPMTGGRGPMPRGWWKCPEVCWKQLMDEQAS